jgi:branched-chain amino acid transport system substrate-binding protein
MKRLLPTLLFALLATAAQADVIKVGVLLPLTGEYDFMGKATLDGMQLALADAGSTKHRYKLICEDTELKPGRTALAARKLTTIDHADILVSMGGDEAIAVCPICDSKKIPHVASDWTLRWVEGYKYTVNVSQSCSDYATLLIKMMRRWGTKRVAILYPNSGFSVYTMPYIIDQLKKQPGMAIVACETFNPPVRDFRTILMKINEQKPDLIFSLTILPESEIVLRQARELGIGCRITGYFEDISERKLVKGISFICFTNPASQWFESYKARFHKEPPYSTSYGYDMMAAIIHDCEQFDHKPGAEEFVRGAKVMPSWVGASGIITPHKNGMITMPFKVVTYKNGQLIDDPQFADLNKEMGW